MRARLRRAGWARLACLLALLAAPGPLRAADPGRAPKPGDYCPLPAPGEVSSCLTGARQEYSDFFEGIEGDGVVDAALAARLEAHVARGAEGPRPYEALSSLAYGYYRLAERAAAAEHTPPEIAARLERWNTLLLQAFDRSESDPRFRDAVQTAAADIGARAPRLRLRCLDAEGNTTQCNTTEAVVRGMQAARDTTGVRGQLGRILERVMGPESP